MSIFDKAFESFLEKSFAHAADCSTVTSWGGSDSYYVELFEDGTYRVLWGGMVGNLYISPGLLLPVPCLTDEEWDEDEGLRFYGNALDSMRETYREVVSLTA